MKITVQLIGLYSGGSNVDEPDILCTREDIPVTPELSAALQQVFAAKEAVSKSSSLCGHLFVVVKGIE